MFGLMSVALSTLLMAQSVYPGQHRDKLKLPVAAPMKAQAFDLQDVRLLPGRFRENLQRDSAWMASIEVNRLLHSFRTNAGVYAATGCERFKQKGDSLVN